MERGRKWKGDAEEGQGPVVEDVDLLEGEFFLQGRHRAGVIGAAVFAVVEMDGKFFIKKVFELRIYKKTKELF